MNSKRDRLEIIKDILSVIRDKGDKSRRTHILYKSNLSHEMLNKYLDELISKEFVMEVPNKKSIKTYALTDKGYNFLKEYAVIKGFTESYGLFSA